MTAYTAAWANRRGVGLPRRPRRRDGITAAAAAATGLAARAGQSTVSLGPLLTGAAAAL